MLSQSNRAGILFAKTRAILRRFAAALYIYIVQMFILLSEAFIDGFPISCQHRSTSLRQEGTVEGPLSTALRGGCTRRGRVEMAESDKIKLTSRFPRGMQSAGRTPETRSPRLLPSILNGEAALSSGIRSPVDPLRASTERFWSRYHRGCMARSSAFMDWSAVRSQEKKGKNNIPPKVRNDHYKDEEEIIITNYLNRHKRFLESYVAECVPAEDIENWLHHKLKSPSIISLESRQKPKHKYKLVNSRKQIFAELRHILQNDLSEQDLLVELATKIANVIGVDTYRIFKLSPDHPEVVQYFVFDYTKFSAAQRPYITLTRAMTDVSLILEIAKNGNVVRLSGLDKPDVHMQNPDSFFKMSKLKNMKNANHVMYQPILTSTGETGYLIEFWRVDDSFSDVEEELCTCFLMWGSLSIHYCGLYQEKKRERNMSDFLLDVVRAIFEEMVSLDQLIKRILEFAQKLVNADRASLFLVDYRNFELVSTVFDLKYEPGQDRDMEKKEIRMPINRGIAGHVALSGETMNIPDAYLDNRFNREVDEATGYRTVSILCMPIKVEGKVIGVVQMVNKRNDDTFGHDDEVAFEIFSTFFGLALHHARLYDRIMRKEQKYRVALEVLSYHSTCRENEVQALLNDEEPHYTKLNDFSLDPYKLNEFEKCKSVLTMFDDLFDISKFDIVTVTRFILTVKKNYRTVPYHNFDHGWAVAHSMYVILKNDIRRRFDYKMRLALFVACLCHDLDHRGYTNKYMSETASPLAAMYTTSTLEHHHFNITVNILQQEGHNIFSHFSSEEYKVILGYIRQAILATDLAAFFPNLEKMKELYKESAGVRFNWNIPSHRDLALAISMTASDLSASAKPWEVQIKTVKVIFEEFYDQGDKELAAGRIPIAMMDRNKPEEQPSSQVGFLRQICIPCYTMLYKILPNTKPMYLMAMRNLIKWKVRADRIERQLEYGANRKKDLSNDESYTEDNNAEQTDDAKDDTENDVNDITEDSKPYDTWQEHDPPSWDEEDSIVDENVMNTGLLKYITDTTDEEASSMERQNH
ncbi:probable 3',5'-cyclic phosphodiesterase pde-5 [Galleria mellonella]|uniref:Phosphodiesterase n=1 Tax=Galleria mellonella TaxID=7137 RepID=A0ABM3MJ60_GALME|nr:probable 3',5'-cyclic phosphodiesterase pde-5 [Galleria mellonella]